MLSSRPSPSGPDSARRSTPGAFDNRAIFPDLEDLQDIIASGDTVTIRWVVTGSQQREFIGRKTLLFLFPECLQIR